MQEIVEIIVMEGIGAVMLWFAYAIGVRHRMSLIAGYNKRTAASVRDNPGLARLAARLCVSIGLASMLMPVLTFLWGREPAGMYTVIGGYGGFILGALAVTVLEAREFTGPAIADQQGRKNMHS